MAAHQRPVDTVVWNEPHKCPFCGTELADPGAGFIDHIDDATSCKESFETWRDNIRGDLGGEWTG